MPVNDERFAISGWEDDLQDIDEEKHPHETPEKEILWAAEKGNLNVIIKLVESDPHLVHVRDDDGYTPLQRACYGNHVKIAEYLLSHGAKISTKSEMQWEPLHSVCQWNNKECVQLLLQNGANVNAVSEGGQTPLHIAASHGVCYDNVQLLLMHPYINPELKNNSEETARDNALRKSKYSNVFDMAFAPLNGIGD